VNNFGDAGDGTCDDTECTLREAISAAVSGDKVIFTPGPAQVIVLSDGPIRIVSKTLSIDGGGRITVSADLLFRVFEVDGGPQVSFTGITIRDGDAGSEDGGGIWVHNDASVHVVNSTIRENAANMGGGIFVETESELEVVGSTIEENYGKVAGGGIVARGEVTVIASTLSRNFTLEGGGGLYVWKGGKATVTGSTFSGNSANSGGGIAVSEGQVDLRSTTIAANDGIEGPGGFAFGRSSVSAINTIVAGNTSELGGGPDCTLNSIYSSFGSLGYNLYGSSCEPGSGMHATDVEVNPAQVFVEVLQPLADNGGPTKTHALILRGRAIDAGYCPGESTDQRGLARPIGDASMPNKLDGCDIAPTSCRAPSSHGPT
jgi:CSLREA domain-containing protein